MLEQDKISISYDRRYSSTLTLDEAPGAEDLTSARKYIPGYDESTAVVYLDLVSGNDANSGASEVLAKLTYASAATAAGTTKKIRVINSGASLSATNITKPTEMKRGLLGSISGSQTSPIDTITQASSTTFSSTAISDVAYSPKLNIYCAIGANKIATSTDANTWTSRTPANSDQLYCICWDSINDLFLIGAGGSTTKIHYSSNGIDWFTFNSSLLTSGDTINSLISIKDHGRIYSFSGLGAISYSTNGLDWFSLPTPLALSVNNAFSGSCYNKSDDTIVASNYAGIIYSVGGNVWQVSTQTAFASTDSVLDVCYSDDLDLYVAVGGEPVAGTGTGIIATSTDANTWTKIGTTSFSTSAINSVDYSPFYGVFMACGRDGKIAYSSSGSSWTQISSPGFSTSIITQGRYFLHVNKFIFVGVSGKIGFSGSPTVSISAPIAGFTVNYCSYSGTISLYSISSNSMVATNSIEIVCGKFKNASCSNNTLSVIKTLVSGDLTIYASPVSSQAVKVTSNTVSGRLTFINSSATGFELISDNIIENGITATYNVTVQSGNTRGTSTNVIFGSKCTFDDPNFVDTTDYKLQFRSNGYSANSLAVAASTFFLNSAGARRDIGAWSYVESAVTYYYNKSAVIDKGDITIAKEMVVSTQQGDTGEVSVYTNRNRIREILTYAYNFADTTTIDILNYIENECDDLTVKICDDPDYFTNAGAVVANGNHSIGDVVLNIDSQATHSGMTITINDSVYYVLYALPSQSATTKLVLNKPLQDAVTDNDVIASNYPSGVGEYQYQPQQRLVLKRPEKSSLKSWREGLTITFTRGWQ